MKWWKLCRPNWQAPRQNGRSLIVIALGDRGDAKLPPAVLRAASAGDKQVRLAAIQVVGRMGDASTVPALLGIATDADAELSQAAKAALAELPGEKVNAELARRLPEAQGKSQAVLIELVGQRRVSAVPELVKVLRHSDGTIRNAALAALGRTAGPKDVAVLISQVTSAKNTADAEIAERALQTACVRMPDREATAAELAAAMPQCFDGYQSEPVTNPGRDGRTEGFGDDWRCRQRRRRGTTGRRNPRAR